jgi:hypothetical protein
VGFFGRGGLKKQSEKLNCINEKSQEIFRWISVNLLTIGT